MTPPISHKSGQSELYHPPYHADSMLHQQHWSSPSRRSKIGSAWVIISSLLNPPRCDKGVFEYPFNYDRAPAPSLPLGGCLVGGGVEEAEEAAQGLSDLTWSRANHFGSCSVLWMKTSLMVFPLSCCLITKHGSKWTLYMGNMYCIECAFKVFRGV